ncbi:MAG: hypothetical protein AAB356_07090, partial [Deltaproteobacteria bacterium]
RWVSAGQTERKKEFVSALGFLKQFPGNLTSEMVDAEKRFEAELEEAKFQRHADRVRKSA